MPQIKDYYNNIHCIRKNKIASDKSVHRGLIHILGSVYQIPVTLIFDSV